jgi:cytochrome b6-f complex iron-sulfur subunit
MQNDRRRFLQMMGATAATAFAAQCMIACSSSDDGGVTATPPNVKDFPVGTIKGIAGQAVIVGRDAGGLYALTSICTHDACDILTEGTVASTGISCNCHGSKFTINGDVTQGPAKAALTHFEVTVGKDGAITVNKAKSVEKDARTAVA